MGDAKHSRTCDGDKFLLPFVLASLLSSGRLMLFPGFRAAKEELGVFAALNLGLALETDASPGNCRRGS